MGMEIQFHATSTDVGCKREEEEEDLFPFMGMRLTRYSHI
jgi:hypothetical protein